MTTQQAKGYMIQAGVMLCCFIGGVVAERTGAVDSFSVWVEKESGVDLPWVEQPKGGFFGRLF